MSNSNANLLIVSDHHVSSDLSFRDSILAQRIVQDAADGIFLVDSSWRILDANQRASIRLGYSHDELVSLTKGDLIVDFDPALFRQHWQQVVIGNMLHLEYTLRRKDGTQFPVEVHISRMIVEGQCYALIFSHDITDRKLIENELRESVQREAQANEMKSRFLSMVSHEFRTPMAIIVTISDILRRYKDKISEDSRVEHLTRIKHQIQHLNNLVEDVLALGKAETDIQINQEPTDLKQLVSDIIADVHLAMQTNCCVDLKVVGKAGNVLVDRQHITQIVTNLLTNALKYSPATSPIEVRIKVQPEELLLEVEDQGMGIPEDDKPHLFEIFHRASNTKLIQGTGLGLALIQRIVMTYGGDISFQSDLDKGTTFTVRLPLSPMAHNYEPKRTGVV